MGSTMLKSNRRKSYVKSLGVSKELAQLLAETDSVVVK